MRRSMDDGPGAIRVELGSSGRWYLLRRPSGDIARPLPLVVELHGRGIAPRPFDRWTRFSALADEGGFVVAIPAAHQERWNDGRFGTGGPDDVGFLLSVIDDVARRLPIDPHGVSVIGMSNGAAMAGRLACERGERLAAVAQVAGTAAMPVAVGCGRRAPLPLLSIHGTADRVAPYAGGRRSGLLNRLLVRGAEAPSSGVDDWLARWVAGNGAESEPVVERLGPDTWVRRWRGSSARSDVVAYRVVGGGHTWPGNREPLPPFLFGSTTRTFEATLVIRDFLVAHGPSAGSRPAAALTLT